MTITKLFPNLPPHTNQLKEPGSRDVQLLAQGYKGIPSRDGTQLNFLPQVVDCFSAWGNTTLVLGKVLQVTDR